ncbi:MAG: Amuc_1102 family pilus-like protein [Chthoniobacterales bacterium]
MKRAALSFLILPILAVASAKAQTRAVAVEFQINKITKSLIASPQYAHGGAQPYESNLEERWLEVEVEFAAAPAWTDELTVKYFVLLGGKLLSGEVTHVNVPAGRDRRSVIYLPPRTLTHFVGTRNLVPNTVQNVAVQLLQGGAVKSELSLERATPRWYLASAPLAGFLLNKNETPFAPLYWDRYEQIKSR